jgi:hypothetical protein
MKLCPLSKRPKRRLIKSTPGVVELGVRVGVLALQAGHVGKLLGRPERRRRVHRPVVHGLVGGGPGQALRRMSDRDFLSFKLLFSCRKIFRHNWGYKLIKSNYEILRGSVIPFPIGFCYRQVAILL